MLDLLIGRQRSFKEFRKSFEPIATSIVSNEEHSWSYLATNAPYIRF